MQTYGFDGVDIDWEYPSAPERSGKATDFESYVKFLTFLKAALGRSGHKYGLSITLPSSYWYLKNFDIVKLSESVDWFNMMSYDLHGTWDSSDKWIGAIVQAHTNLTEINQALDLLWRNDIDPAKVVLGLGFYGRSFTLANPSCTDPGCPFSGGGRAGECTANVGTLSYAEIDRLVASGAKVDLIKDAAVKRVLWGGDQWVSYDDAETMAMKVDYANTNCLGGTMIWAVSLDDNKGSAADALSKSTGRKALAASPKRSDPFKASGPCFITECFEKPTCPSGYGAVQQINGNKQDVNIDHGCAKKEKRTYCCPSDDMPTCQWRGSAPACDVGGGCKSDESALTYDTGGCSTGHKKLCCKNNGADVSLSQCLWKGSAPRCERDNSCPKDHPRELARSISGDNQQECDVYGFGDSQTKQLKVFCCTDPAPYTGCDWYTDGDKNPPPSPRPARCSGRCPIGKTLVATDNMCLAGGTRALCCDPVHTYNDNYVTDFKNSLLRFSDDHKCPADQLEGGIHTKRSHIAARHPMSYYANVVQPNLLSRDFKSMGGYETLQILYAALPLGTQLSSLIVEAYNEVIGKKINLLAVKDLQTGIDADPYNNRLFGLATMLCDWSRAKGAVDGRGANEDVCILPPDNQDFSDIPDSTDDPYKLRRRERKGGLASLLRQVSFRLTPRVSPISSDLPNSPRSRALSNSSSLYLPILSELSKSSGSASSDAGSRVRKRVFDADAGASVREDGGIPSTGQLMNAVMHDGLPLLYMQHVRYQANDPNNRDRDTILEVVYDITNRPDLQFFTAATAIGPYQEDRFAVFHFHTLGVQTEPSGTTYPMHQYVHAFHAQRVQRAQRRPEQWTVVQDETTGGANIPNDMHGGTHQTPGPNARTEVLRCPRVARQQPTVWLPGNQLHQPLQNMQQTITDFGTHMRNAGILVAENFPHWNTQRNRWDWENNPNDPDYYTSDSFGPIENGVRDSPVRMDPDAGWPT